MKAKRALGLAFALMTLALGPSAAFGQDAPATEEAEQLPAEETLGRDDVTTATGNPEDNWLKVCGDLEDGQKACIMRQQVYAGGQFAGSFLLRDDPGQESRLLAIAAVPLGVMLPFGLVWQIDSGKQMRLPYVLCDPASCVTQVVIDDNYVQSLKKGGVLKLIAKNRRNQDITIEIDLAGFTAVYDREESLSFDEFRDASSGTAALEQMLQDRAEQIRRDKEGDTAPTDTPEEETADQ